jgi:hypothetical protein
MAKSKNIELPRDKIAAFCKRNRIRRLSLFGSALNEKLRKDSDIGGGKESGLSRSIRRCYREQAAGSCLSYG